MAYALNPVSQKEGRLGGLSLICLALGIIGPFFGVLPLGPKRVGIAFGIRAVFVVLALVLGFLGRRSRAGRIGLIGSAILLSVIVLLALFLLLRHAARPAASPVSLPSTLPSS
jgi:hypothetical protein